MHGTPFRMVIQATAGCQLFHMLRYTLGGFYLARYSDSPVGAFDEVISNSCNVHDGLVCYDNAVLGSCVNDTSLPSHRA